MSLNLEIDDMKKTLIALAVLAASGASFAQSSVALTGNFTTGYETRQAGSAAVRTGGLGVDGAGIKLVASEDLGGGLKASAQVTLGGMMRDGAGTGEDANLTLDGSFGKIVLATVETAGSGIVARAAAGAPGYDLQGRVYSANSNIDIVSYTTNELAPGVKLSVNYVDRGAATGSGLNAGTSGAAPATPSFGIAVAYALGKVNAGADYTSWTRQGDVLVTANTAKSRVRISGNYDLSVAKLGAGYSRAEATTGVVTSETAFGVSLPIGAITLGAQYGTKKSDEATPVTDSKGYTLGAQYDLSKRTNVSISMFSFDTVAVKDQTGTRVFVSHSF
jgi:predicted porin